MSKKVRDFTFTINDYDFSRRTFACEFFGKSSKYFCMGEEIAPKTGKLHLQCYIYFQHPKTWTAFKKLMDKSTFKGHFELAVEKDPDWQRLYCMKEDKFFFECGERPKQGERTDLSSTRDLLLKTGKMREVVKSTEKFQAIRCSEKYLEYCEKKRDWKPWIVWIWGNAGVGKSRLARRYLDPDDLYETDDNMKWWMGYDAHKDVIIDDFRDSDCSLKYLLKLFDRYGCRVETKGGGRQFLAERIFVTAPLPPDRYYIHVAEDITQLTRRIDRVIHLEKNCTDVIAQKSGVILYPDFDKVLEDIRNLKKNRLEIVSLFNI